MSSLSTVIENVPLGTLQLGQGVDALTGEARSHALHSFNAPTPNKGLYLQCRAEVLDQFNQLNTDIGIGGNATVNVGTPGVSTIATANWLKSKTSSDRQFIIECRVDGQYEHDSLSLQELRLNSQGQSVLKKSAVNFQSKYGDYFVAGVRRRFRSYMLVVCETGEHTKTTDARFEARANFQQFLDAGANANRTAVDSNKYTALHTYLLEYGCHSLDDQQAEPAAPSVVHDADLGHALSALKAAASNASHYHGIPKDAILWHYSLLDRVTIDRQLQIQPQIFDLLHSIEKDCKQLEFDCLHPALDSYAPIRQQALQAVERFRNRRSVLVKHHKTHEDVLVGVAEAVAKVNNVIQRYVLLEDLLTLAVGEPAVNKKISVGGKAPSARLYGEISALSLAQTGQVPQSVTLRNGLPAFQVTLVLPKGKHLLKTIWDKLTDRATVLKMERCPPGHSPALTPGTHTHWENADFCISGWSIANDNSSRSEFWVQYGGIFQNQLCVAVTDRPWYCHIVYVRRNDYNFPSLFGRYNP